MRRYRLLTVGQWLVFFAGGCAGLSIGCANTVEHAAATAGTAAGQAAVPAAIDQLSQLKRPENQAHLASVAQSPAVRSLTHQVGEGVGRGITDEWVTIATGDPPAGGDATRPGDAGRIRATMQRDIDPIVDDLVHAITTRVVRDLTTPETLSAVSPLGETIAHSAGRGLLRAFSEEGAPMLAGLIRDQIGPAIGDAVRQQLSQSIDAGAGKDLRQGLHEALYQEAVPAIRQAWDQSAVDTLLLPTRPDLAPAVRENAHNLAYGTSTGTDEAMINLGVLAPSGGLSWKAKATIWSAVAVGAIVMITWIASMVVLVSVALTWRRSLMVRR